MRSRLTLVKIDNSLKESSLSRLSKIRKELKVLINTKHSKRESLCPEKTCSMIDLDANEKLICLKVEELRHKVKMYLYHFGEHFLCLKISKELDNFEQEHKRMFDKFEIWLDRGGDE
ncbi:MAG: hypothetical protein VW418_04845 [Gammaproteobacteria bacterium]